MKYLNFKPKNFYDFYLLMSAIRGPDYLDDFAMKEVFTNFIRTAVFKNKDFSFLAPTEHVINELIYTVRKVAKSNFFITHYLSHIKEALEVLKKYVKNKKLIKDYYALADYVMTLLCDVKSGKEEWIKPTIDNIKEIAKEICKELEVDYNSGEAVIIWRKLQKILKKKVEE